jgi:hypothetical protein
MEATFEQARTTTTRSATAKTWTARVVGSLHVLFLGAVLLTGYLGGATATHVRVGEPFFFPVVFGVLLWACLCVRDERVRTLLLPRRRNETA